MNITRCTAFFFPALLFAASLSVAHALPLVSDHFTKTGQTETLVAPLAVFGGVHTSQQWSGTIEIVVDGVGANFPAVGGFTDAFYYYVPGSPDTHMASRDDQNWGLLMSFTGCAAGLECAAPSVLNFTIFTEGVGFVTPLVNSLPGGPGRHEVMPYSADHLYHFVMDIGSTPRTLTLGYGDGGVFDNSGQFDIQLFAVAPTPSAAPEPATPLLLCVGLILLGGSRVWMSCGPSTSEKISVFLFGENVRHA